MEGTRRVDRNRGTAWVIGQTVSYDSEIAWGIMLSEKRGTAIFEGGPRTYRILIELETADSESHRGSRRRVDR